MVAREAVEYAKKCFADGFSDAEVSKALADAGWPDKEVGEAIKKAQGKVVESSPVGGPGGGGLEGVAERIREFAWPGLAGLAIGLAGILLWVWGLTSCEHCLKSWSALAMVVVPLLVVSVGAVFALKKFVLK